MAGDPPLDQVVTRTLEAGVRGGTIARRISWNAGLFRADNRDDILFVASEQTGFGYFKNFGKTRRQGVELGAQQPARQRVTLGAGYTLLDATYESAETVNGASNSTNDARPTASPASRARSRSSPATAFRSSRGTCSRRSPTSRDHRALSLDARSGGGVGLVRARQREQRARAGRRCTTSAPARTDGYAVVNLGAGYQLAPAAAAARAGQQPVRPRYSHRRAARARPASPTTGNFIARPFPPIDGEFPVQHATFYAPGAPATFWVGTRFKF